MKAKTFFMAALSCALLLLGGSAALVAWADPLLTVGTLDEGETALFVNERYELAGLIRRQDYSNLIMGTSLAANFRASWFTDWLGSGTLKIAIPDGRLDEFDTALELAYRTHGTIDRVFFGLDPNVLIREDQHSELPEYLYNDNVLDDLQFYFNAESLALAVKSLILGEEAKAPLDEAYVWDWDHTFATGAALGSYLRPEAVSDPLPADAYLAAAEANMDVICGWAQEHPDTQFMVWFPPYSILYWDQASRLGTKEAILTAIEYACGRLLACGNVEVFSFLNSQDTITNLNNYTDHIHYSGRTAAWMSRKMLAGQWRYWADAYQGQVNELREFVNNYDYEALFD
ncbi:MAG: hypothetical protein HDT37_07610 [Clostridiales bacterium]|nr:hypothetical protein [Clostridiales bacterium]